MRLIKYAHACVRLERDGRSILIDPGIWADPEVYQGVSSILVTHEHYDHVNVDLLPSVLAANPGLKIYTSGAVAAQLSGLGEAIVTVSVGESFTTEGFRVDVVGGEHAEVYEGLPGCANLGYIMDGEIYHPGDSLHVPTVAVPTLLLPVSGPWLKLAEILDFVRAVAPARAFGIHDAMLSAIGMDSVDNWVRTKGQTDYARIPLGTGVDL